MQGLCADGKCRRFGQHARLKENPQFGDGESHIAIEEKVQM